MPPELNRIPPQNIEAEQMVLGAVLIENEALDTLIDLIAPEDFYRDAHRTIFAAMLSLHEKRTAVDLITLTDALLGDGALSTVGGAAYLSTLVSLVPTAANIRHHAAIVRGKSLFRRTIRAATDIIDLGFLEPQPLAADEFVDRAEAAIFEIAQGKGAASSFVPMKQSLRDGWIALEKRFETKGTITGIATGFVNLDVMLAGLQPSDLVIIAARPAMGKTAFALNIAEHAAFGQKKSVALFSLEMSRDQLVMRLLGSEARVDINHIRTGQISGDDWERLSNAAGRLSETRLFIDETAALTALDVRARSRRLKAQHGLDLVVVDYLQLMRGNGSEGSREQEISGITRSLKALAKELGVPVVALSQLNRALESRAENDRRPRLSDLRESGAIEQDADVVLFLYRQEAYTPCECPVDCGCGRRGTAEVIIGKQRNGPVGKVDLAYLKQFTRFENAVRRGMA